MLTELKISTTRVGQTIVFFPVVFEKKQPTISFSTFQKCSAGVLDAYRSAEVALFGSTSQVELELGAFEDGSFKTWFGGVAIATVGWAGLEFLDGFVEGATGKTVAQYGQIAGEFISRGATESVDNIAKMMAVAETCSAILSADNDTFERIISERPEAVDLGLLGRMKFYEACKNDQEIPAVRFGESPSAIRVTRDEFGSRSRRHRIDPHPTDGLIGILGEWRYAVLEIVVTSPTWDREDHQRKWKGRLPDGKYIYFDISDSGFWKRVLDRELETASPDLMTAQILYQDVNGRYKSAKAVKILKFNDQEISIGLGPGELLERIEELNAAANHQTELFGIHNQSD